MREWVLRLLPDLTLGETMAVVRDVLSLLLAGLGAVLATLAIKLGRDQAKTAAEQTAIAKRQSEIAEVQHRIMQDQLTRRASVEMSITQGIPIAGGRTLCRVYVHNNGNRSVQSYNWEFIIAAEYHERIHLNLPEEAKREEEMQAVGGRVCWVYRGYRQEPVWPKVQSELLTIDFKDLRPEWGNIEFWWRVFCEDGPFPTEQDFGYLTVKLYSS